jgi:RecA/RadA recombinase
MARPKKVKNEDVEETEESKKPKSLIERMKARSTATSFILSDDEFPVKRYISTGNYMLNALISADPFLGAPTGRSIQLAGQKGVGKTFVGLELMKNALNIHKDYIGQILDSEFANNDNRAQRERGLPTEQILWTGIDTIEKTKTEIITQLDNLVKGDDCVMLIDSIGMLPSEKELIESRTTVAEKRDMTRAQALKSLFRTITMPLGYKDVLLVAINHVYAATGSFIPHDVVAGGGGPAYGTSIIVIMSKSALKDGDEVVGSVIRAKTEKNRFAREKAEIRFNIEFSGGINLYSGLLEFCIDEELLVVPKGGMPKSGDIHKVKEFLFNGKADKVLKYAQLTPKFWEWYLHDGGLADILREHFKYSTIADQIDDDEFDPILLTE